MGPAAAATAERWSGPRSSRPVPAGAAGSSSTSTSRTRARFASTSRSGSPPSRSHRAVRCSSAAYSERVQIAGHRVLLTGATGGLGRAIAQALHERGAHLLLSGRNEQALAELVGELGNADALAADLANRD